MDDIDLRILRAIQDQPEASVEQIGQTVGLSHTPCWRRLHRLQKDGVIAGRYYKLDRGALGLPVTVFAFIKLRQHDETALSEFEAAVQRIPAVIDCHSMTGQFDYLLRVVTRDVADYEALLKKTISHLPYMQDIHSSFALREVKLAHRLPI